MLIVIIGFSCLLGSGHSAFGFDNLGLMPPQPLGVFSTLNTDTAGKGRYQIMLSVERSIDTSFYRFSLSTEYGVTEDSDVLFTLPFVTGLEDTEGLDDISLGFKGRLIREFKYSPTLSYVLSFSIPGKDVLTSHGHAGGGIVLSKRVGPFQGSLNMFYYKPTNASQEDLFETRIGLDLAAGHNLNIMSELLIRKGHDTETVDLIEGRFGYRVRISSNTFSVLGVGYDFKNRNPEWRFFFSLSMGFPEVKENIKEIYEEE